MSGTCPGKDSTRAEKQTNGGDMKFSFAERMNSVKESFIREIMKVTDKPEIISFAGGLPNPGLFPVTEIAAAAQKALMNNGKRALQYATTEGYLPLREYIAARYKAKQGLEISPDEILITNGSQQGIDLVAKILLNKGDHVIIERPGYLGAIQAISLYEPEFHGITMDEEGVDTDLLLEILEKNVVKLFYAVPSFQNPSGITYSQERREKVAEILKRTSTIFLEDNPYGDLRFSGTEMPLIKSLLKEQGILMGSFSKITAPGTRLGWICAEKEIMDKLKVAKQAADLHSNFLSQVIIHQYLLDNDLDQHIRKINALYHKQCRQMLSAIQQHFPPEVTCTKPEGGMFLWVTLPAGKSSMELFEKAIQEKVAFVPGEAFYADGGGDSSFRLNFSNSNEEQIEIGIKKLSESIKQML